MVYTGPQVHSWHEAVDWSTVADAGHTFAWVPATTGIASVEPRFRTNWDDMAAAGLVRGAVHTLSPYYVGRGEARHFVSVLGDPAGALTALVVQPEGHVLSGRMPSLDQVADFAEEFARLTDGHPLIIRPCWRAWIRKDVNGRGYQISPYLWHGESALSADGALYWSGGSRGWPRYGGWTAPTIWGASRTTCAGIAGLCAVTLFSGNLQALSALLGLDVDQADDVDPDRPGPGLLGWLRSRWPRGRRAR